MTEGETAKERFEELEPEVRAFLGRLDPGDVDLLERSISITRHVASAGKVVKWTFITLVALIVSIAALGDAVTKIWHWWVPLR